MGYWTNTVERYKIRDRSNHPWAHLLKKTLAVVEPATLAELEANGELDAFLSCKVDDCMKSIRSMQSKGMEYEAAKEIAFEDMLPRQAEETEGDDDWIREGAEQDAIDQFSRWSERYGTSDPPVED